MDGLVVAWQTSNVPVSVLGSVSTNERTGLDLIDQSEALQQSDQTSLSMSDWRYCYCCLLSSEYKIDLIITTISTYSQSIAETFINLGQYRISIKI